MSFPFSLFAQGMHTARLEEDLLDGLKAAIELWFEDFSDADTMDRKFRDALETVYWAGANQGYDIDDLITEVQEQMTANTGRRFATTAKEDSDG